MKIGMMCLWNAANGPSIHAELVGRAWVKLGHQLRVFSATEHPDARPTLQRDEDFVIRHFSVDEVIPITRAICFDPSPLLSKLPRRKRRGFGPITTMARFKTAASVQYLHQPGT